MQRAILALAMLALGCGDSAPRGAPPPRDPAPAAAPAPTARTGTEPTGTDPTGTEPTGTDPTGTDPTGTDPTGTDPTGTDSTGTDSTGTDPTGTDPSETAEAGETGAEPAEPEAPIDPEHPERTFRVRPEQERSFEAYACLGRRDYACIERLLGDGRAQTAGEMSILIRAQRAQNEDSLACASMQSLFDRFPESTETARYRAIHYQTCPR
jgi:hypothetical protein